MGAIDPLPQKVVKGKLHPGTPQTTRKIFEDSEIVQQLIENKTASIKRQDPGLENFIFKKHIREDLKSVATATSRNSIQGSPFVTQFKSKKIKDSPALMERLNNWLEK